MSQRKDVSLRPGLIFDVGMHQGEDTDFYLKKGFSVVAFEANPDLAARCRTRFASEIASGQLVIVEGAIIDAPPAESPCTVKFHRYAKNTGWGTVAGDWVDRNASLGKSQETIEVPVVDFAAQLEKHGIPHYLKIDIEGMDTACLRALRDFRHKPNYVSIESEKVAPTKLEDEFALLVELGYTSFKAVQQKRISRQREPRPAKEGRHVGYRFEEGASGLFGADLPGPWHDLNRIRQEYQSIFRLYELFGDYGSMKKSLYGRMLRVMLSLWLRRPIPGWYDTHAKHAAVVG
jgi:FkbM family methyltransferase